VIENSKISAFDLRISTLEQSLTNCQRQLAELQESLITTVLDNAIADARILPVERKLWHNELHGNFGVASAQLANTNPQLQRPPRTDNIHRTSVTAQTPDQRGKRISALVNEKMQSKGLTYDQAWFETKASHPELFASQS